MFARVFPLTTIVGRYGLRTQSTLASSDLRVLITGASGQLGLELARVLRSKNGADSVVCTDIKMCPPAVRQQGPYEYCDATDYERLSSLIVSNNINCLVHFAAILSAAGERNPDLALRVNIEGAHVALRLARNFGLRLFAPSTIGAFGPSTPRDGTPDVTVQRPNTIYGVSKVYLELLGDWYAERHHIDFRCLRYPGIISADVAPGGGTTDYAVDIYANAVRNNRYECYLRPDSTLPMMYIDDCLSATAMFLQAPRASLKQNVYNVAAMSFNPEEVARSIARHQPGFEITYNVDTAVRQRIADSWPRSLDDSNARRDWGWNHAYDLDRMTERMLSLMRAQANKK